MERVVTALLELSLPMAAVIALLLAAGPLLGRRFAAKWRWWAWLLLAVRLLVPVEISLPQPVLTLPQPQAEITYTLPQKAEPILPGERFSETPLQVLPGGEEALPSAQRPYEQLAQDTKNAATKGGVLERGVEYFYEHVEAPLARAVEETLTGAGADSDFFAWIRAQSEGMSRAAYERSLRLSGRDSGDQQIRLDKSDVSD